MQILLLFLIFILSCDSDSPTQGCSSDIDCEGVCGGTSEIDECDVCNGDGIAVGTCDCDGNVVDECGICNGNGIVEGTCDCDGNVEDCSGACGGNSVTDQCDMCDGDGSTCCASFSLPENSFHISEGGEVSYYINFSLAGFQFDVEPSEFFNLPTVGSGGNAEEYSWTVQTNGTTVLGFSFGGISIPPGCGILTNLTFNQNITGVIESEEEGPIWSDENQNQIQVDYHNP